MAVLKWLPSQAEYLHQQAVRLARAGGPQAAGVRERAEASASALRELLDPGQRAVVDGYASNRTTLLVVEGMREVGEGVPETRPSLESLKVDFDCQVLASRSQLLLNLCDNRAFAYDLDYNEMVRIVGNFKGGGQHKIPEEPAPEDVELSSHSGLALGAHTEPPYYCSFHATQRRSPAPSTLILTARWNPLQEPTQVIPVTPVLEALGEPVVDALTRKHYQFTRPDSYVPGDEDGRDVSIVDYNPHGDYAFRFSAYRFSACAGAPETAHRALAALQAGIANAERLQVTLDSSKAILINNTKALHCRDSIKDNRRILVRLFGYNRFSTAIVQSTDPMLVQG
ncbi:hypothetical protein ACJ2CR_16500 [Myxococcus faecalis]|uniref:hypothetical protein n=1 Tax=Myxococcus faecalis TaxID=3115646 RepID=UPI001E14EA7A|nr:hypothetical protein [Myxococcus sp. XM-1-1-1]